ncbi:MAG: hypothetical protein D6741_16945, partial [Planctomycetota bacterium]
VVSEQQTLQERRDSLAAKEAELEELTHMLERAETDLTRRQAELEDQHTALEAERDRLCQFEEELKKREADLASRQEAFDRQVETFEAQRRAWEEESARREDASRNPEESLPRAESSDQRVVAHSPSSDEKKTTASQPESQKNEKDDAQPKRRSPFEQEPVEASAAKRHRDTRTVQSGDAAKPARPTGEPPIVAVGRVPRFRRRKGKRYLAAAGLIVVFLGIAAGVYTQRDRIVPPEYETTARIEFPANSLLAAVRDGYNPIAPESEPSGAKVLPNQSTLLMSAVQHDAYFEASMPEDAHDRLSFLADRLEVYAVERLPFVRLSLKGRDPQGAEAVLRTIADEYGKTLRGVGTLRANAYLQKIRSDLEDRELQLEDVDKKLADIEKKLGTRNPYQLEIQQQFAQQQIAALRKEKGDLQIERTTKEARRRELSRVMEDDASVDMARVRKELEKDPETLKLLATEDVLVQRLAELQAAKPSPDNEASAAGESGSSDGENGNGKDDGPAAVRLVRNQLTAVRKQLDPLRREAEQRVLKQMREEAEI